MPHQKHSSRGVLEWNLKHPWEVFFLNSCSEYFQEIPRITSVTKLIFSTVMSFQYALCCKWFTMNFPKISRTAFSKNRAGGMLLILSDYSLKISRIAFSKNRAGEMLLILSDYSLKISRTPFKPLMLGGNKYHTYLSKPSTKTSRFV